MAARCRDSLKGVVFRDDVLFVESVVRKVPPYGGSAWLPKIQVLDVAGDKPPPSRGRCEGLEPGSSAQGSRESRAGEARAAG
jgi:hypothetical protein